jgi:hypothetical protein
VRKRYLQELSGCARVIWTNFPHHFALRSERKMVRKSLQVGARWPSLLEQPSLSLFNYAQRL